MTFEKIEQASGKCKKYYQWEALNGDNIQEYIQNVCDFEVTVQFKQYGIVIYKDCNIQGLDKRDGLFNN